jgi:hypothetical protein
VLLDDPRMMAELHNQARARLCARVCARTRARACVPVCVFV